MINDDSKWSAPYHPTPKTEQGFIMLREWARKRALEMFAETEAGRRMANMIRSKKNNKLV
jgi:hypothetical protein